jgi:hypothetical protein
LNKDRLGVIIALLLQMGAVIWWASQLDTIVRSQEKRLVSCEAVDIISLRQRTDLEARVYAMEKRFDTIEMLIREQTRILNDRK